MEGNADPEHRLMIEESSQRSMPMDPSRARYPCCIVWSPLPVISWLIPFVGHIGICREDGVILDFAGPNFVCVDSFAFGSPTRYILVNKEKQCSISPYLSGFNAENPYQPNEPGREEALTWDDALQKSTQEFQHREYNLFTCNCHSFVANNLNRLSLNSGGWNVVNLAAFMFLHGRWVSISAVLRTFLPFVIVTFLGLTFGGTTYLTFLAFFTCLLIGWFLLGTYCFKSLIRL
ncbi:hypothetical protein EZV62_014311 [Acer yangbiense]|uniref:Uncharacterized protein n=1 Tax=Acer yangbiense TaxID=1000413 RepID=A0A5C7HSC0_9ROSI|nr:hypothetical protein EZV62_014311 [Acer yangbiense]